MPCTNELENLTGWRKTIALSILLILLKSSNFFLHWHHMSHHFCAQYLYSYSGISNDHKNISLVKNNSLANAFKMLSMQLFRVLLLLPTQIIYVLHFRLFDRSGPTDIGPERVTEVSIGNLFYLFWIPAPPHVITNKFVYARIGQSIRLQCEAIANPPVTRVFWDLQDSSKADRFPTYGKMSSQVNENNSQNLDSLSMRKPHHWPSPILQINSITQDDAGTYRCVAENIVHESGGPPTQKRSEDFTTIYVYCK